MLDYSEITPKKCIIFDNEPYEVLSSHVFRKQMRKPVNQTKLRHMITGRIVEQSFHQAEKVREADIETKEIKYLYASRGESWFCDASDPSKRFTLTDAVLEGKQKFLKPNTLVEAMVFAEAVIGVRLPIKVELLVKEAAPAVKGNTVQGGTKQVVLETGATLNTPMFINEGDIIRINTETGDYVERVDKK
ncbi:MAG: elongation factor P [Patescibacteria group bacterium]